MKKEKPLRIGIIEPGLVREPLRDSFGDYPFMLKVLLSSHFSADQFDSFSIVSGEQLPEPKDYDGFVIMGSAHGVKDGLPWFDGLCDWIRLVVKQRVALVGICFGHQAIAQALGGDVGRSAGGWCVGLQHYTVAGRTNGQADNHTDDQTDNQVDGQPEVTAHAFHQDQVVKAPPGADTVMSTSLCPHAGFLIPDRPVFTMQFHPEFTTSYAKALLELTAGNSVDPASAESGLASLEQVADAQTLAKAIAVALNHGDKAAIVDALLSRTC